MTRNPPACASKQSSSMFPALSLMAAAVGLQAVMSAMVKLLGTTYPMGELVFARNFFALVPLVLMLRIMNISPRTIHDITGHFYRAVLGILATTLYFVSLDMLPLAQAVALGFTSPIFTALLSWPLVRERVRSTVWIAIAVGSVGVYFCSHVISVNASAGALVALAGALFLAWSRITVRQLSVTNSTVTISFWFSVNGAILSGISLLFNCKVPDYHDTVILAGIGFTGGVSQFFVAQAHKLYNAASMAPVDYTGLVWAGLIGYVLWDEIPDATSVIGSIFIVGSGLILIAGDRLQIFPPSR